MKICMKSCQICTFVVLLAYPVLTNEECGGIYGIELQQVMETFD